MRAVHRAAGHIHGHRGKGCTGGSAKAQLLAFQVAHVLIDRESRRRWQNDRLFSALRHSVRSFRGRSS